MNKLFISGLVICLLFSCSEPKKTVHLKGQLKEMGTQNVVMHYNGAASLVGDSRDITIHTDAEGRFDTIIDLVHPEFYSISRNTLYLTPGDDLEMTVTQTNTEASFTGVGAEANTYMKKRLFPKGGSFLEAGRNVRDDFSATRQVVDSLATIRRAELKALTGVSEEFRALENARITADVVNSYISYASYAKEFRGLSREEAGLAQEAHLRNISGEITLMNEELADEKLLDVAVVRDVLSYQAEDKYGWFNGITLPERTKELYAAYDEADVLREKVSTETVDRVNGFIAAAKQSDIATELKHKVAQVSKLLPGQPAFDLVLEDVNGGTRRLSDFKGKIIYVDLWATWCGPCIEESPAFEALSEKYKDQEILFVPVSTDTGKSKWLEYLSQHEKHLAQYNSTDQALKEGWCIMYIPRFILIDREFNIIDAYAPRPSSEEIVGLLDTLLSNK